ncbi:IclR family transcriptional regulator [Clostridium sp. Marseille-P2415]|uniref:IclR family transcriptional regulator n=1 Tax=Clostridium sp. Marseille-P2415 TaxID=1805471 RepID=UPI001F28A98F|nr:IclR family transcriptional regulator [Clostridium sp. Marseille-P2415]
MEQTRVGVKSNHSAGKMLTILEYMAEQSEPVRLLDISKALNINVSTLLRFLTALVEKGYAKQEEETSRYYLTYKICVLGHQVCSRFDLRNFVHPYMKEIAALCGELVCLAVEQDGQIVYIETIEGRRNMLHTMKRIGKIAPMHCTGIGKLFLLDYSEEKLDSLIREKGLTKYTEKTLTTKTKLLKELNTIRKRGYAFDDEECEVGNSCVAFPLYNSAGKMIAGISVSGPVNPLCVENIRSNIERIQDIIKEINNTLTGII